MNFLNSLSPLNRQALMGILCVCASALLVWALKWRGFAKLPGGELLALVARFLLGFCFLAGIWWAGNALFGRIV